MKSIILKILTFTIITLTALVLIFKPELVRTMIPGIVEKVYVAINKIIPIERKEDLNLSIILVAMIMPVFAGIMRSICEFDEGGIKGILAGMLMPLLIPLGYIAVCVLTGLIGMLIGGAILYMLFKVPPLFVIISYIFCCYIIFSEPKTATATSATATATNVVLESVFNM